jgi:alpha-1,2-mannosyltransferase
MADVSLDKAQYPAASRTRARLSGLVDWRMPLLAALVALLAAWAGWLLAGPLRLDVGRPVDTGFLRGWYDRETGVHGTYRWSSPEAAIDLPAVPGPAVLSMRMVGRPEGSAIRLSVDHWPVGTIRLEPEFARTYRFLTPGGSATGFTTIALSGPSVPGIDAEDTRRLTALLDTAELRPLGRTPAPPLAALLPALCAMIGFGMLRLLGLRPRWALIGATAAGMALGLGWGWARLWVAPFLLPTAAGALVVLILLAAVRGMIGWERPVRGPALLGAFAVFGGLIPIFTFVRYDWQNLTHWHNLPLLLIPLGLALCRMQHAACSMQHAKGRRQNSAFTALIMLVAGGYATGMLWVVVTTDYGRDFHAIYEGVSEFIRGMGPLYNLAELRANPLDALYKYPPSFALLFAPFAWPSFVPALYAWRIVNGLLLIVAAWALLRAYNVRLRSWAGAGLLLLLFLLRPIPDTLRYGQLDVLLLALLALGLLAIRRERWGWMGVAIGVAAALKLYPAYLLGLALIRRKPWAIAGAALTGGAIGLASLAFPGWGAWQIFLSEVLGTTGVGTGWVENQTFNGFVNRLLSPERIDLSPDGGGWLRAATYAWFAAGTALTFYLTRPGGGMRADIAYGLWITALLLVLPAAWFHYQVILLIPLFQAFVLAEERAEGLAWPAVAAFALAWGLLAHGNMWTFYHAALYGPYWQLLLSYKFYAMLLLYAAIWRAWEGVGGRGRAWEGVGGRERA